MKLIQIQRCLCIDSESRPTKEEAYLEVLNITKTDSALRGNIGAELKAVADAAGRKSVFLACGIS